MAPRNALRVAAFILVAALCSGCPGPAPVDGGADAPTPDAPAIACATAADCDDGVFCTGTETCTAGRCVTTPVVCDDGIACTTDRCSEERLRCVNDPPDVDRDGYFDATCLDTEGDPIGNDCADDDAMRYPGNRELCDASHDEDCDALTLGGTDNDSDSYVSITCCNGTTCGTDCDDARTATFPGATEVCDGLDQNCDGVADDGVSLAGYVDADRDGWGNTAMPLSACASAAGWVPMDHGGDCADDLTANPSARAINPGQPEICDSIRNDCDAVLGADVGAGAVDWYADTDGDGFGSTTSGVTRSCVPVTGSVLLGTDCDDTVAARNPAATETCNGRDDDCNGLSDFRIAANDFEDDDADGFVDIACAPVGTDCNDRDASSGPGEAERCDGRDNDCDSRVDEGATELVYYRDSDADGFGSESSGSIVACMPSLGYVARGGDCNDADTSRFPGATERCNSADEDCDSAIDESPAAVMCAGMVANASSAICTGGRCGIGECAIGFDDCNRRDSDGCEISVATNNANCGACGVRCATGETCGGGTCNCNPGAIACPGGCIDPLRDGRFCGASSTCSGPNAGRACVAGDRCAAGACIAIACGNGFREVGEACDDGNNVVDAKCSADCSTSTPYGATDTYSTMEDFGISAGTDDVVQVVAGATIGCMDEPTFMMCDAVRVAGQAATFRFRGGSVTGNISYSGGTDGVHIFNFCGGIFSSRYGTNARGAGYAVFNFFGTGLSSTRPTGVRVGGVSRVTGTLANGDPLDFTIDALGEYSVNFGTGVDTDLDGIPNGCDQ